jgi:hypothetical protein
MSLALALINGIPRQQTITVSLPLIYDESISVVASGASGSNQINASPASTSITLPSSESYTLNTNSVANIQIYLNGDRTEQVFDWNTVGVGPNYTQFAFTFAVVAGDRIDLVIERNS